MLTRYDGNSYVQLDNWFDTSLMLPRIYEPRDYATAYIFTPLHFKDRCFGYSVLSYGGVPRSYDTTFRKWIKNVNSSLESLRRQIKLQYMYKRMEQMAVTDMLTGLYNRNGFNLYSAEEFKKAQENGEVFCAVCRQYEADGAFGAVHFPFVRDGHMLRAAPKPDHRFAPAAHFAGYGGGDVRKAGENS